MTADELRHIASQIASGDSFYFDDAADYLRACADALDEGPTGFASQESLGWLGSGVSVMIHAKRTAHASTPLYPLAMPSIPQGWKLVPVEPTPDMLEDGANTIRDNGGNARWSDVREAWDNMLSAAPTPPVAAQSLRLPEPMTDAEVDHYGKRALMGHLPVREMIRAVEAETMRRVKEANK